MSKTKAVFKIDAEFDVMFVPFGPVTERDDFEIRIQVRNEGAAGPVDIGIYYDVIDEKHLVKYQSMMIESNSYGFMRFFWDLRGKKGEHTIFITLADTSGSGAIIKTPCVEKKLLIREHAPNLLEGGFVMLSFPNDRYPCDGFRRALKELTDKQWKQLISSYNEMGQKIIIITVSVQLLSYKSGKLVADYPSSLYPKSDIKAHDPIKAILEEADKNNQVVFIGLGHSYGRGPKVNNPIEVAKEIFELYKGYKSFIGWYESREASLAVEVEEEVWELWRELRSMADSLSPVKLIATSPYMFGPKKVRGVHHSVVERLKKGSTGINIMIPQDCVGVGMQTVQESGESFAILEKALKGTGTHLWANCESFDFGRHTERDDILLVPRFKNGGFNGVGGFVQQMEAVRPFVEKITTFMLTGLFTPPSFSPEIGGPEAVRQYQDYWEYMRKQTKQIVSQTDI